MKILCLYFIAILQVSCNNNYKDVSISQYTGIVGISSNGCVCNEIKQEDKSNE